MPMTQAPPLVLLHSPLVGPLTWRSVAAELRARGFRAEVPSLLFGDGATFSHGTGLRDRLVEQAAAACRKAAGVEDDGAAAASTPRSDAASGAESGAGAESDDVSGSESDAPVLVVHSNAGALVPSIAALAPVRAAVFVDALLPHPGRSWFDTVDPETAGFLRDLSLGGVLPPWHTWFPSDAFHELLPDPILRAVFLQELAPLPLAYFEETAPDLPTPPGAYVQTSDAYDAEADRAEALGWPIVRLPLGNHLAPLTHPRTIADTIVDAVAELAVAPRR